MLLLRAPAVYPAQGDTWLLADAIAGETVTPASRVLDLCCGSGALALAAAKLGAGRVTAVDISRRAVLSTWLNTRARGMPVRVRRGDLGGPVAGERFDLVVANPPYVPAAVDDLPDRGRARCWDAGVDGRGVLDRLCDEVPPLLAPGGVLLVVFSALCGVEETSARMARAGLEPSVVARRIEPFGPVMRGRVGMLEGRGLITPGQRYEELVVVRGRAAA